MNAKANLDEKLALFSEHFAPRTVAVLNGHDVMVVKAKGKLAWHTHEDTGDFFLVLRGRLLLRMRGPRRCRARAGELFVVPRGVEHQPVAEEETHLLLIEPTGTPNAAVYGLEESIELERWMRLPVKEVLS